MAKQTGVCAGGKTLMQCLEEGKELFEETGYYFGIKELKLFKEDPLKYEGFHLRLIHATLAAREVEKYISASPLLREASEAACALYTPEGDSLAFSPGLLIHVHTMSRIIKWMIEHNYEEEVGIKEGDGFFCNDPSITGVHGVDQYDIAPVFYQGQLIGWAGGMSHVMDSGGSEPAGQGPSMITRFHEGVVHPPVKVVENGKLRRDWDHYLQRRVRYPDVVILDQRARVAACQMMSDALKNIVEEFGVDYYLRAIREILEEGRQTLFKRIKERLIPGKYRDVGFYDVLLESQPVPDSFKKNALLHYPLELTIEKDGKVILDLDGTSPEGWHHVNMWPGGVEGGYFSTMCCMFAYDGKVNDGAWYGTEIKCPEGSVVNPKNIYVGSGTMWMPLLVWISRYMNCVSRGLFARGYREEVFVGANMSCCPTFEGINQYGQPFGGVLVEAQAAGSGARGVMDGIDCGYAEWAGPLCDMGNAEVWELVFPVVYLSRRLRPDSGGYGKFRGGNAFTCMWLVANTSEARIGSFGSCIKVFHSRGIFGGYPALVNYKHRATESNLKQLIEERQPIPRGDDYDLKHPDIGRLTGKVELGIPGDHVPHLMKEYDLYEHHWLGGGGLGDPIDRDPKSIANDLSLNYTKPIAAEKVYGISAQKDENNTWKIDYEKTKELRKNIRKERLKRSIPFEDWRDENRKRILGKRLAPAVMDMYKGSMSISPKFERQFRQFWNLPDDFEF